MRKVRLEMLVSIACLLLMSCIVESEFDMEFPNLYEIDIFPNSHVEKVITAYEQDGSDIFTFDPENDIIIEAYVISSDSGGNFFKTLVIQDAPENPARGLEVKIDLRAYYLKYNFGRKIFIKMGGLSIQKIEGKYVLGYRQQENLTHIPESLIDQYIFRSEVTETMVPRAIELQHIRPEMINTYLLVEDLQFMREELGNSFASESYDKYQGERKIEQCDNNVRSYLFTSTYARFKANLIPEEIFSLKAILTLDSFSRKLNFVLNNTDDLVVSNAERCDPVYFTCGEEEDLKVTNERVIFYEDFDQLAYTRDIEKIGWRNINKNFGSGKFKKRSSDDNVYLQVSAYGSNEAVMECWLISPDIEMGGALQKQLFFDIRSTFEEGELLTLWFSQDYSDSIDQATWHQLYTDIPAGSTDGSKKEFSLIGPINLSCIEGKFRLAFKYMGNDPGDATTYDLDNILIKVEPE